MPESTVDPIVKRSAVAETFEALGSRLVNRLIRLTPREAMLVPTNEPVVTFTFDDVPDSALFQGAAILENHGARGTFYISGGLGGRIEADRTLIDEAGCRELAARGHEIGCHTYAHRSLSATRSQTIAADLARNARHLDCLTPGPALRRNFAFPYNAGSLTARGLLADTFRTCRAGGDRINRGRVDPCFMSAVEIRQPETHAEALTDWIDALIAAPGWLIFFTHDIADAPTPYGCTPRSFERLVAYAVAKGCRILNTASALDHFGLREEARSGERRELYPNRRTGD